MKNKYNKYNNYSTLLTWFWLIILAVMPVFSAMMSARLPKIVQYILPVLMLVAAFFSTMNNGKLHISFKISGYYVPWIAFGVIVLLGARGNFLGAVRILSCIILPLLVKKSQNWIKKAIYVFSTVLGINVFFTFFFFLFPQYYSGIISLYEYIPSGTSGGTAGYRAGIANHYSQNGIYISLFLILIMNIILSYYTYNKQIKHKKLLFFSTAAGFAALLLSGKRGVLLWSICAIILTYLISSGKKSSKIARIVMLFAFAYIFLQGLSNYVPAIGYSFQRFESIGEDNASLERMAMWDLAFKLFKTSPVFGIGFWKYRLAYCENLASIWHPNSTRYQFLDSHNVYLQVLCETGVIGFIVYILAIGSLLCKIIKIVNSMYLFDSSYYRFGAMFSLCIQIFYCIYSLTGNCLYDIVFYFYGLAACLTVYLDNKLSKSKKEAVVKLEI